MLMGVSRSQTFNNPVGGSSHSRQADSCGGSSTPDKPILWEGVPTPISQFLWEGVPTPDKSIPVEGVPTPDAPSNVSRKFLPPDGQIIRFLPITDILQFRAHVMCGVSAPPL